jgi:hypothetical protein
MLNTRIGENYNANDVINSNDLRKRILNIDSTFRSDIADPTTAFTYKLEHPYKNLIRLRVASVEVPNMFYTFTKRNNCFTIKAFDISGIVRVVTITIEEGNYTSAELIDAIQDQLDKNLRDPFGIFISIALNVINAKVTFTHNGVASYPVTGASPVPTASAKPWVLDFCSCSPVKNRKQNFGLGYNLGFRQKAYKVTNLKKTTATPPLDTYFQTSEACIDVVGEKYMLLCVNDFYTVEQRTSETYIQCLAKIIIREEKHTVIYDDGSSFLANEIIFPSPTDLKILQVRLLDPYGEPVDLCGMNFSFSLEITEVLNTKLYDFYRNYIWLGTIPSVNYKTVQGSAQPLLKGMGPPW